MFYKLHDELAKTEWKYHKLENVEGEGIVFKAISMDPDGVNEVMRIKAIADRYLYHLKWDGENIEIVGLP